MNVKSLTKALKYRGEAEGKRQTYYVFEGNGYYFICNRSGVIARSGFCDEAISALQVRIDQVGDCFAKTARNDGWG